MPLHFEYDHDIQTVYAALTDPQYLVKRNLALGELSASADVEDDEDDIVITALREISRDLPETVDRYLSAVQVMDMREVWHPHGDGWRGEWRMDVRDEPVTITASFELVPTPRGCRYSIAHRASAEMPLVGAKVEEYLLDETDRGAQEELEYLRSYLA